MKKIFMVLGVLLGVAGILPAQNQAPQPQGKHPLVPMAFQKPLPKPAPVPLDRDAEVRIGPRVSFLTGDVRVGKTGTDFNIWDDLKLDEFNEGIKADWDWRPVNRWHLGAGFTWDKYDQRGFTQKNISDGENTLVSGASLRTDLTLYQFKGSIGYELIRNKTWRVTPYVAGHGVYVEGSASFNGNVLNSSGVQIATGRNKSTSFDEIRGFGFGGIDSRAYLARNWHLGLDVNATGWDSWYHLGGDVYTGYDFNQSWGIRMGYTGDYVHRENTPKSSSLEPIMGSLYMQILWGY